MISQTDKTELLNDFYIMCLLTLNQNLMRSIPPALSGK